MRQQKGELHKYSIIWPILFNDQELLVSGPPLIVIVHNLPSNGEEISSSHVPPWILCLSSFNHLALIFNASTNFVIYFARGDHFKMSVFRILQSIWRRYIIIISLTISFLPLLQQALVHLFKYSIFSAFVEGQLLWERGKKSIWEDKPRAKPQQGKRTLRNH